MRKILVATLLMVGLMAVTAAAVDLIAGQHIDAGWVTVDTNGFGITVTYNTTDGWVLEETHLYVGTEPPRKSAPGRFPYKHEELGGVTSDSYFVSLDELEVECGVTIYLATHAVVSKPGEGSETAWGEGELIGKNWAMFFDVDVECDDPPPSY